MYVEVLKRDVDLQIPHFADNIQNHREKSMKQLKPLHEYAIICFQHF